MNRFFEVLQSLIRMGTENEIEMNRNGEKQLALPILLFLLLVCIGFWLIIPLMIVGLFCGCSYSFRGPNLGKDSINKGMSHVSGAAERIKEDFKRECTDYSNTSH